MALLQSEIQLIKYELGFNQLSTGAVPYIGIVSIFDQIVARYLLGGLVTTSSTSVAASTTPAQRTLTLAAITGTNTQGDTVTIGVGDRLVIDVDDRQESAIVESMSGSTATLLLSLAHSGTYSCTVEGGESIVRGLLRNCRTAGAKLALAMSRAGIRKVDEVEFFQGAGASGSTVFSELTAQRQYWRGELYRALFGVGDPTVSSGGGSGGNISVY